MSVTSVEQLMKEMDEVLSAASVKSTGSKTKNAAVAALEAKAAAALAQKQAAAAAKEAEKAAAKAAKAAEKEATAAAKKAAKEAAKAAEKEAAKAEKETAKAAKAAEREAAKAAKAAEKAAKPKRPVGRPPKAKSPPASVAEAAAGLVALHDAPVLLAAASPAAAAAAAAEVAELSQARLTVQALRAAESELRTRLAAMESAYHSVLARLDAVRQLVAV